MEKNRRAKHARVPVPPQKKKSKKRGVALFAAVLSLAVMIAAGGMILHAMNNPQSLFETRETATREPAATPAGGLAATPGQGDASTPEPTPEYTFEGDRVNILALGLDMSPERVAAGENFRTDTMLLISVDFTNGDMDLISIPRDSYVRVNGDGNHNKVNAAFVVGGGAKKDGYAYAMDTVSWVLGGIPVDYYVGFGMTTVKEVVDAMGGIDYDVDIAFTMNGRETLKGLQHMDGQKVLDYCRYRMGGRGDIDRVDRQQRMLLEMFSQLQSTGQIKNIPAIYQAVSEQLDTNMDLMQVAALAYWARNITPDDLHRHTLPGEGLYIGKTSYWVIDQQKKAAMVKDIFGVDIQTPPEEDMGVIKAMASEIGMKVSRVIALVTPLREGIYNGTITDPAILNAVAIAEGALMSEKSAELDVAIMALLPYADQTPATDPAWETDWNNFDPEAVG